MSLGSPEQEVSFLHHVANHKQVLHADRMLTVLIRVSGVVKATWLQIEQSLKTDNSRHGCQSQ